MKTISVFLLSFLVFASCNSNTESSVKEFTHLPEGNEMDPEVVDFKLARVPDIKVKVTRYFPEMTDEMREDDTVIEEDLYYYRIEFGKISESDFQLLKKTYYDNPKLTYSASRSYDLVDFMPPQIQALNEHRFNWETVDSPVAFGDGKNYSFSTVTNCWSTAYEINRGSSTETNSFYMDGVEMNAFLHDDSYSRALGTYTVKPDNWDSVESRAVRNKDLKTFDTVLFSGADREWNPDELLHTAIFIDDDLYFEKTAPTEHVNYRFVRFEDIARAYLESMGAYDHLKVEPRRFDKKPLPKATDLFSYAKTGKDFIEGSTNEALFQAYPNLKDFAIGSSSDGREFYVVGEASLQFDSQTQRYVIGEEGFKPLMPKIIGAKN